MDPASLDVLSQVAEVAGVALWGGATRRADFFNERWVAYTGEPSEVWFARGWETAIHEDDRARVATAWSEALRHRAIGDVEARLRNSGGEYRWHRVRFLLANDQRWFGIASDLGERHRDDDTATRAWARERSARADAEQANRLKDRFFAAVSHELRAPIAALLLWERLLREQDLGGDERKRALDAIHDSALSQARLVDDLIDVARVTAGKLAVRLEPVELGDVLERAIQESRPAAAEKRQELDVVIAPTLGRVNGDATRLVQIVVNLLENAIKFTPRGGRVSLAARCENDVTIVDVVDSGRGIAKESLPHVFDMFRQIEGEASEDKPGLGLGLAIASELVTLHGGTLEARSGGLGTGATFSMRLPATHQAVATLSRPTAPTLAGISLLVVDDDPRVLAALEILLGRAGADVRCADSVVNAWSALARSVPDVVISDLAMPVLDGFELVRRMRRELPFAAVPVIALTAHAALALAERVRAEGFAMHIAKPVDLDVLVAAIASVAGR